MKTSALYIPLLFALIFLSYLLSYGVLDPGPKGFYVEVGGVAPASECGDTQNFVLEVLPGNHSRLNGKSVDQQELLQRFQNAFQYRPERVIYVLADRDATMQDVVTTIDIANGAAKNVHVRLVTPGNQNEMCLGRDPLASLRSADR